MALSDDSPPRQPGSRRPPPLDADALLCALVLAPGTYSRNRFFQLFEVPQLKRARRRAKRVRGIIRQLLGQGREPAEIVGERVLEDRVLLRFQIRDLNYQRTTSLSPLEAALIHYSLNKQQGAPVSEEDRKLVENALVRLGGALEADITSTQEDS